MFFDSEAMRTSAGPTIDETREEIRSRAEKLLGAYQENIAGLLEERGLQHGAPDPEGHIHYAEQMVRVLKTILHADLDPYRWPKNFERPDHIPVVFINGNNEPTVKEITARDFDNPKKLIDSVEEILTVGQIKGL